MTNIVTDAPARAPRPLCELADLIALALDASERPRGHRYSQSERECRSYLHKALRQTNRLLGGEMGERTHG